MGDTPFCSEQCRQQQIDNDKTVENGSKISAATTREQQMQQQNNTHRVPFNLDSLEASINPVAYIPNPTSMKTIRNCAGTHGASQDC
jgi:hypothetical protein